MEEMIPRDFDGIHRILVIKLRHIGDVLLTVPVFRALRENFPDAHLAALVNSGTEEVLTGNPLIDEIIVFERKIKKLSFWRKYFREVSFLKKIRHSGIDMTVDLTSGDRAAMLSLISRARYRLAYNPGKRGLRGKKYFYTHLAERDSSRHMVVQNVDLLRQFGIRSANIAVDFFIPEDARSFIRGVFNENGIAGNDKVVHVHPTSRWLFKCWKDEYMADVINWLLGRGVKVVLTSSPEPKEIRKAQSIIRLCRPPAGNDPCLIDLCGRTTIKQLAAVSAMSDLFFGVDSAPMHIAAAVGTPVLAIFGPSGAHNWGPWYGGEGRSPHTVVKRERACPHCTGSRCHDEVCRYLLEIKPSEITRIMEGYLARNSSRDLSNGEQSGNLRPLGRP
jgi:heptosyltransferase-3